MKKFTLGILILFLISVTEFRKVVGGYANFLCPLDENSKEMFPCEVDCQVNHGAQGGQCGNRTRKDFNCYCGTLTGYGNSKAVQCLEKKDSFRQLCTVDCICNHGSKGGYCNWEQKACICGQNSNPQNAKCPTRSYVDFTKLSYNLVGSVIYAVPGAEKLVQGY